jgi:hypothetical protein
MAEQTTVSEDVINTRLSAAMAAGDHELVDILTLASLGRIAVCAHALVVRKVVNPHEQKVFFAELVWTATDATATILDVANAQQSKT